MRTAWRALGAVASVAAILAAGLPMPTQAAASPVNWEQEAPGQSPPARTFAASAYDSARNRVVLFGGSTATSNLGDTWEFDGTTWVQKFPATSPPPLAATAMVYDSAIGRSVLFGGSTSTGTSSDTWEWDGGTWTRLNLVTSPPPMVWAAMAYDSTRGRIVLFGAYNSFGAWLSAMWEFDGTAWTQLSPAHRPSVRYGAAMAFDSSRNRTVLFGGWKADVGGRLSDTWEWDGTDWTQISVATSPYERWAHTMAFDPVRNRTILFGGDHFQPYALGDTNDTWEWDGTTWVRDWTDAAPGVRAGQSMVYDSASGRMVLFGGYNAGVSPNAYFSDTWELGTGIVTAAGSPALTTSISSGEFGSVDVGASTAQTVVSVASSGTGPAVTQMSITGDFAIAGTDCPSSPDPLASGSTCLLFLTFSPTAAGDRYGSLTFAGNLSAGSLVIPLHGFGIDRDFTISASPGTINVQAGYQQVTAAVTTTQIGDTGTIVLSGQSNDPGITASFNPASIAAGAGSTATITIASSVVPGFYAIRLFGAEGTITHYAEISIQVSPAPDFTIAADPSTVTVAHGSSVQVAIDTTAINGVLSITPSAVASPAGPTLSFSQPYITAGGVGILTIGAGFGVAPGHYTVTVTGAAGSITHSTTVVVTVTTKGLINAGFETGDLSGWDHTGVVAATRYAHTGAYGAQVGSSLNVAGDSTLAQTFDVPASAHRLVFWFRNECNDSSKNDWFTATLKDGVTGTTSMLVPRLCIKKGAWTKVTVNLSSHAGHYVTVTFVDHDNGVAATETITLVDDVSVS